MYSEQDLLMLSGLQHYIFCPRQWALIHIEQQWSENILTMHGNIMHEKVHSSISEQRGKIRTARSLKIVSYTLGLAGQTDVVEFHRRQTKEGLQVPGVSGSWQPFPIEYKLGKPKKDKSDEVQLCAQAICLEEMLGVVIDKGALFYGKQKRRMEIEFTQDLRKLTFQTAEKIHDIFNTRHTPRAIFEKKCKSCSLMDICLPERMSKNLNIRSYTQRMIASSL